MRADGNGANSGSARLAGLAPYARYAPYLPAPPPYRRSARGRLLWAVRGVLAVLTRAREQPRIARWEGRLASAWAEAVLGVDWEAYARLHLYRVHRAERNEASAELPLPDGVQREFELAPGLVFGIWADAAAAIASGMRVRLDPADIAAALAHPDTLGMVRGIPDTLREELRRVMTQAYQDEVGPQGFARRIRELWPEVARRRAKLIAHTEYARAASAATLIGYRRQGITHKSWQTLGDGRVCPACRANAAQGAIAIDESFQGNVAHPPQHPACRCSVSSVFVAPPTPPPTPRPTPRPRKPRRPAPAEDVPGFATLEEAERWAAARYPHIRWDFAGAHVETITPTLRELNRLLQEYPQVARHIRYIGTYLSPSAPTRAGFPDDSVWAHAVARFSEQTYWIGLNPRWYGSPDRFRRSLVDSVRPGLYGKRFHPEGTDSIESVIAHEFGHLVDYWAQLQANKAFHPVVSVDGLGLVTETHARFKQANRATDRTTALVRGQGRDWEGARERGSEGARGRRSEGARERGNAI